MAEPCTNFAQIKFDECLIQNNAWGYEGHHPPQCIQGPPGAMPGWKWDWPGQDRTQVQAYPELIYGKKPWSATSTTPGLPQRLSGISRIEADYDIHTKASGCYNAAFELWLTRTSAADSADITSEIMIWVSRKGMRPAGSFLKSVETPHGTADLYEALSMPWRYLAFVLDQEMLTGRIDLSFFWSRSWLWAALILPCFWQASSLETRSLSDRARLG